MDKTYCVTCKIFHEPNDGCPVFVPMMAAVPQCPSCASFRAEVALYKERWELEQIIREGISSANDELRKENRRLHAHDCASAINVVKQENSALRKVAQAVKQLSDYPIEGIEDYLLRRFVQECVDQLREVKGD